MQKSESLQQKYDKYIEKLKKELDLKTDKQAYLYITDRWYLFDPYFVSYIHNKVNDINKLSQ